MTDKIAAQTTMSPPQPATQPESDPKSFDFDQFIEQMMDPDGVVLSLSARSDGGSLFGFSFEGGFIGLQMGYNQQDGFDMQPNAKTTPKSETEDTTIGGKKVSLQLGGRWGIPYIDGVNTPTVGVDA